MTARGVGARAVLAVVTVVVVLPSLGGGGGRIADVDAPLQRSAMIPAAPGAVRPLPEAARSRPDADGAAGRVARPAQDREPAPVAPSHARGSDESAATARFAAVGPLRLHLPAASPAVVGYHEASRAAALALRPLGTMTENHNTTRFTAPASPNPGPDYVVMSSRGRHPPPTSAVDVVMADGQAVRSPVTGRVTVVRPYRLYGRYDDHRIELAPRAAPHLRVVLIHVDGVRVRPGDRVVAGRSILATGANRFPFTSHVDRYTAPARHGHVHLEVKHRSSPAAADDG